MELRQLRQFVTLAETLNFHRAAERLNMSQPPLSVSIRRLEEELGTALFTRGAGGVRLTGAGMAALEEARLALRHAEQVALAAQGVQAGERGLLRIGFIGSATPRLLPRLVPPFRGLLPAVELTLRESTTAAILEGVAAGEMDLGLLRYPLVRPVPDLAVELLEPDALVAALPPGHALGAARGPLPLAALRDEPFVTFDAVAVPGLSAVVALACQQAGFQPRLRQEAVQAQTVISLVESGLGVALVPGVSARTHAGRARFRPLAEAAAAVIGIAMAVRRSGMPPLAHRFQVLARQTMRQHRQAGDKSTSEQLFR